LIPGRGGCDRAGGSWWWPAAAVSVVSAIPWVWWGMRGGRGTVYGCCLPARCGGTTTYRNNSRLPPRPKTNTHLYQVDLGI